MCYHVWLPSALFLGLLAHRHHGLHTLYWFSFPMLSYMKCLNLRRPPCPPQGIMKVNKVWCSSSSILLTALCPLKGMPDTEGKGSGQAILVDEVFQVTSWVPCQGLFHSYECLNGTAQPPSAVSLSSSLSSQSGWLSDQVAKPDGFSQELQETLQHV